MVADAIENMLRSFSFALDIIISTIFKDIYNLIYEISNISIFGNETMAKFTTRLWAVIGVVMLFKITISLISMFANPDSFYDSKKGMGNIVKRVMVSLILIGSVSFIFQAAFRIQHIVLEENIITNIILGTSNDLERTSNYQKNAGKYMAFDIFAGFFSPNPKVEDQTTKDLYAEMIRLKDYDVVSSYMSKKVGGHFQFTYKYFISTIVLGVATWILFMFCFDVAIRSVKLSFLQLIAPLPIIAYIDPNKGEKTFKSWLSQCVSTYLDVFIRLAVLNFGVFAISEIATGMYFTYDSSGTLVEVAKNPNFFTQTFIIVGILLFINQLPQLIADMLGIKLGNFTLNPLKKIQNAAGLGMAATYTTGMAAGAITGVRHDQNNNKLRAALSGAWGAKQQLKGKVGFIGTKPGSAHVSGISIGREAGYEIATGSKMKKHSPFDWAFRSSGEEENDKIKKSYLTPLQEELSMVQLEKSKIADKYKKVTTKEEQDNLYAEYGKLNKREIEISKTIDVFRDQIKDNKRAYDLDESNKQKLGKATSFADGVIKENANKSSDSTVSSNQTSSASNSTVSSNQTSSASTSTSNKKSSDSLNIPFQNKNKK